MIMASVRRRFFVARITRGLVPLFAVAGAMVLGLAAIMRHGPT